MKKRLFSVVLPIYKNELNLCDTIPKILRELPEILPDYDLELIMINDASPDGSLKIMQDFQLKYPSIIRIASFVHNEGQALAIHYGVSIARGDAIGVISADLQDPIAMFPEMVRSIEDGCDLVCGIRAERQEKGLNALLSKLTHKMIKYFINSQYPEGGFDFFVISRDLASNWMKIKEHNGSMQLQLLSVSANSRFISYTRMERNAGKSSWTFSKKIKYFIDTFASNSYIPLRIMSVFGSICAGLSFLYGLFIFVRALFVDSDVPGWSSLALIMIFFFGIILICLGIIGEYLWRVLDEVKQRPLYFVKNENFSEKAEDEDYKSSVDN